MTAPKRRRLLLYLAGLVVVVLATSMVWRCFRRAPVPGLAGPPPDPRLTFPTPYRNVRPEVRYVGSAACARCHGQIAASFHRHPMGRATAPAAELVARFIGLLPSGQEPLAAAPVVASRLSQAEQYDARAQDPFPAFGLDHRVELRGGQVIHQETLYDARRRVVASLESPVFMAISSGARTRSYLIARNDAVVESPLTWYVRQGRWDLSPGYRDPRRPHYFEHFERPVTDGCLSCHASAVEPVKGSLNRYRLPLVQEQGIGCERCHGPGELHVEARRRGDVLDDPDPTVVNPGHLEPSLREAVCEQCHLQGHFRVLRPGREWFEFRPGLPLDLFWSVFDLPPVKSDQHKSIRTVEQMHDSRCYQQSRGALGCISCHDPHELPAPEEKAAYYRQRCLQCHAGGTRGRSGLPHAPECSEAEPVRRARGDSCIACHMTPLASSNIPHTANIDHRVLRRPDALDTAPAAPRDSDSRQPLLVRVPADSRAEDRSRDRDLGIALALWAVDGDDREAARAALPLLQAALRDGPDDLPALKARASALGVLGRIEESVAVYDALLTRAPGQEEYLLGAGELAEKGGHYDKATDFYRRALGINPNRATTHVSLAWCYVHAEQWRPAAEQLEMALRLNPFDVGARRTLLVCYVRTGQRHRAEEEFDRVLEFKPADGEELRRWFARELRTLRD